MKFTKEEITGFTGSFLFCSLLLLAMSFIVLKSQLSSGEEGILVNFGTVDFSMGNDEPRAQGSDRYASFEEGAPFIEDVVEAQTTPVEQPQIRPQQEVVPANRPSTPETSSSVVTQDLEETIALEEAKKEKAREEQRLRTEAEAEQRRLAEEKRLADERRRKQEAINQQVSGAFGVGTSNKSQEGNAGSGTGNQGSSEGNAPTGAYQGVGGYGSFDLAGRSVGQGGLPRPVYTVQDEGRIVVDITVDPRGNVIFAEIGKGTNIDNTSMRRSALEAAKKAKFNSITGTNNQSGTITYNYKLN